MGEQLRFSKEEYAKLVEKVDSITESPSERARKVWNHLQKDSELDTWDTLCFCAWFLMSMIPDFPFLSSFGKTLNLQVHDYHYQAHEELGLKPRK